jgi:hypothetical protein
MEKRRFHKRGVDAQTSAAQVEIELDVALGGNPEIFSALRSEGRDSVEIPGGGRLIFPPPKKVQIEGPPITGFALAGLCVKFVLELGRDVSVGVLSAWLYDKLKASSIKTVKVNNKCFEVTRPKVAHLLKKTMRKAKSSR